MKQIRKRVLGIDAPPPRPTTCAALLVAVVLSILFLSLRGLWLVVAWATG